MLTWTEFFIIARDFKQANLKIGLPKFQHHVTCSTRGWNVLDHVYSTIREGYKVTAFPHLGQSDHLPHCFTSAYRPLISEENVLGLGNNILCAITNGLFNLTYG